MLLAAYVDESYDLTIGVYILTASIIDLTEAEEIRCALHTLRTGAGKLHWYKSDPHRKLDLAKAVGALGLDHLAIIGRGQNLHPERARRKCMERLLPEVESAAVDMVTFEARQSRNDRQDRELIAVCRRKRLLSARLHATFVPGGTEPLLWVADVACGAALAAQRGELSYLEQFGDSAQLLTMHMN